MIITKIPLILMSIGLLIWARAGALRIIKKWKKSCIEKLQDKFNAIARIPEEMDPNEWYTIDDCCDFYEVVDQVSLFFTDMVRLTLLELRDLRYIEEKTFGGIKKYKKSSNFSDTQPKTPKLLALV